MSKKIQSKRDFSMLNKGLAQYQKLNTQSAVEGASPHRLIQMLMEGVLQRLSEAKGAMLRHEVSVKAEALGKGISIIGGLRDSLNKEVGGDIANNLDELYDYMQRRLLEANVQNNSDYVDEVMALMRTIKSGWDDIAEEVV